MFGVCNNILGFNSGYMVPWGVDMFNGIPGSMNIMFNQGLADMQARASMECSCI